jgi:hypothetical protein
LYNFSVAHETRQTTTKPTVLLPMDFGSCVPQGAARVGLAINAARTGDMVGVSLPSGAGHTCHHQCRQVHGLTPGDAHMSILDQLQPPPKRYNGTVAVWFSSHYQVDSLLHLDLTAKALGRWQETETYR